MVAKTEKDRRVSSGVVKSPLCGSVKQKTDQKGISPYERLWVTSVSAKNVDLACVWSCNISWVQKQK